MYRRSCSAAVAAALLTGASFGASGLDEFKVKREAVFEFAQKPTVRRAGDRITIEFETKGLELSQPLRGMEITALYKPVHLGNRGRAGVIVVAVYFCTCIHFLQRLARCGNHGSFRNPLPQVNNLINLAGGPGYGQNSACDPVRNHWISCDTLTMPTNTE